MSRKNTGFMRVFGILAICFFVGLFGFLILGRSWQEQQRTGPTFIPLPDSTRDTSPPPIPTVSIQTPDTPNTEIPDERKPSPYDQLYLLDWHWSSKYRYAITEGEVKNISSKALRNVAALVTFRDKNHKYVSHASALVEFDPILPNQVTPFRVTARWNPEIKYASIKFKFLSGGTLHTFRKNVTPK